jgi:putative SOS response-associated peptidase YedK
MAEFYAEISPYRDAVTRSHHVASVKLTTAVHDRMPVILDPDAYDLWLDPGMRDVSAASELLKPYDARLMRCYPISTRINSVVNDDEECSAPVELAQLQNRLFS